MLERGGTAAVFEVLSRNLPRLPVIGMSGFAGAALDLPDGDRRRLFDRAAAAQARALVEQARPLALQYRRGA